MPLIHLISHANVTIDLHTDPGLWSLNKRGTEQSKNLATFELWNDVSHIYVSGENKAQETAQFVTEVHEIPLEINPQLNEFNKDSTGPLPYEEFMQNVDQFFKFPDQSARGWETLHQTQERILKFTQATAPKHNKETIAFIGHGVSLGLLVCHLKNIQKPTHDDIQKEIGSIATIDWRSLKVLNEWEVY